MLLLSHSYFGGDLQIISMEGYGERGVCERLPVVFLSLMPVKPAKHQLFDRSACDGRCVIITDERGSCVERDLP